MVGGIAPEGELKAKIGSADILGDLPAGNKIDSCCRNFSNGVDRNAAGCLKLGLPVAKLNSRPHFIQREVIKKNPWRPGRKSFLKLV